MEKVSSLYRTLAGFLTEMFRSIWPPVASAGQAVWSFLKWGWPLVLLLIGPTLVVLLVIALSSWSGRRHDRSLVKRTAAADNETFIRLIANVFTRLGLPVEKVAVLGGLAVDLVLVGDGTRVVVQAERHRGRAGARAIHEIAAAKELYGCEQALFVTTGRFTKEALAMAEANGVWTWDQDTLRIAFELARVGRRRGQAGPRGGICGFCGRPVPARVRDYCLEREDVFRGRVYCRAHQRPWRVRL